MKLWTVEVNGVELEFWARTYTEARIIIAATVPQSDIDWESLKEKAV